MFDNTRVKYAGYAGGILFVILIISQLPSEFIQRFIPWLLSSAVLVGGSERLDAFNPVIVNEHGDWQSFALDRPAARKGFCLGTDWLKDRHIVYG
jgi:hypothetical protein